MTAQLDAERKRLLDDGVGEADWKRWGPYVSARQWGTVREDYSANGDAWNYLPHDHARSRAYRWGEDGLAGICDRWQHLCFGIALWNGVDPILKERLYGLTNNQGNHGEDVKEAWWPVDSTPTHSWMQWRYLYPQAPFPYGRLTEENSRRDRLTPEFELPDTGVFDDGRYFDITVTYAKAGPDDLLIEIAATNHGPNAAELHLLPTIWFRNTWAWGRDQRHPRLSAAGTSTIATTHSTLGDFWLHCDGEPQLLFTDNETNNERLFGTANQVPYVKDGINDHVVSGAATVNPDNEGTKASAWYRQTLDPGATSVIRLRLNQSADAAVGDAQFATVLAQRRAEADAFYAGMVPPGTSQEATAVHRRAMASLLWGKQYYSFHVEDWLEGDPAFPPPPPERQRGRNQHWRHLGNTDIISMPDAWEYPWYAAWDLAFHMIPFAQIDPEFAKEQLLLFCREWYMHPNGQLPAYEWAFDDVNPPVHAWAAWRVFKIARDVQGEPDYEFLERIFHKLLINFTWWVNRKDTEGNNVFEGGFLGLDNIGLFDRSQALPGGGRLEQADATSWMAMYCLNMLSIALELAEHDPTYEDVATKFFEHFLGIAHALNNLALWDEEDGFFYDVLHLDHGAAIPLKIRSAVGLIPLFAMETLDPDHLDRLPDFSARVAWFLKHRPELCETAFTTHGVSSRRMLSVLGPQRLIRVLERTFAEDEFLSPYGVRSLSQYHRDHPVELHLEGSYHTVGYEPAESQTSLFGGNSNWRGPIWFPINFLLVESLQRYHRYLGDDFTIEFPTGSGHRCNLDEVATALSRRLTSLFLPDEQGRRPVNGGRDLYDHHPQWRDEVMFAEYFDGDTGKGLGAGQQGWTCLAAKLLSQSGD